MIITHGHYDHIGALHILLPQLGFPDVYAPPFASELIKHKLKEEKVLDKVKIITYQEEDIFNFGSLNVRFFRVNHSTPDSFGVVIKTKLGNVIHTGDFKIDTTPEGEKPANLPKIARIGSEGVIALLSDSTNAFRPGFSKSESAITEILRDVVEKSKGRIIVATFSQLVVRINQLLILAKALDRKVVISGRSLETTIQIAMRLGYVNVPKDLFIKIQNINKYPDEKLMIFTTGHQGETMAALSRIARGEHRDVQIKKGDTVILSSSVIPGNDVLIQKMIDDLYSRGAKVFHQGIMDLHAGGHGYQEDQRLMISLTNPKYFIPVHGYQSFLAEHARTAQSVGVLPANCVVAKRGQEIIITKEKVIKGKKYRSTPVLVSGLGIGDIGHTILKEREQLANYGVVSIAIKLDKSKSIFLDSKLETRGVVFVPTFKSLFEKLNIKVRETAMNSFKDSKSIPAMVSNVEREVKNIIRTELKREPLVIINVI